MSGFLWQFALGVVVPPPGALLTVLLRRAIRLRRVSRGFPAEWFAFAVLLGVIWLAGGLGGAAAGCGASALIALAVSWWRRNRQGVARLIGAKARAIRDGLVRRAREALAPRPVLQPVRVPR